MTFDFDGIVNELEKKLSLMSQWKNILYFGVYRRLIDLIAYILEKLVYITEFYYREAIWSEAQLRESLIKICPLLQYTPHRTIAPYGSLELSADPNFSDNYIYTGTTVIIPKWTEFSDEDENLNVFSSEEVIYNSYTSGSASIPVKQGFPKEYIYTAKGHANETITIFSNKIENDIIEIFEVDNNNEIISEIEIVSNIYLENDLQNLKCEIRNKYDFSGIDIIFGDGVNTKKLEEDQKILIKYADTDGENGNIQERLKITKIKSTLYDAYENPVTLYVRNTEAIADGSAPEDIESIRNQAPLLFQTGFRCGNKNDWITILENHPLIHKAKVWTEEDLQEDSLGYNQNVVYGTAISKDGTDLTEEQKTIILRDYIKEKKSPTEFFLWKPLQTIGIQIRVEAKIINISFLEMIQKIKDIFTENYSLLNLEFKQPLYGSQANMILSTLENIVYHNTSYYYIETSLDLGAVVNNYTSLVSFTSNETDDQQEQIYFVPLTMEIWLKRKINYEWQDPIQIGMETASATIEGVNGFVFSNSSINHNTNTVSFICNTIAYNPFEYGPSNPAETEEKGYLIYLIYKTQDGLNRQSDSIRIPYFYQILNFMPEFAQFNLYY